MAAAGRRASDACAPAPAGHARRQGDRGIQCRQLGNAFRGVRMMSDVIALTCELIRRASVSPDDAACQALLAQRLAAAGFAIEHLPSGDVKNLWATHGSGGPVLALLGHTDVVPT